MSSAPQVGIEQALRTALQHHQAGRLGQAEQLYRIVLAQQPNHADALHLLGVAAHQNGRHGIAVELIRQAIAIKPNYPEACSNLGVALYDSGRLDEAIASYRRAIALRPDSADAHGNLGNALSDKGQLDEAIIACRRAIALRPGSHEAHNNLGNALKKKAQLEEARPELASGETVESARGEPVESEAIAAYRQAITLRPDFAEAWSNLGAALYDSGRLDDAIAACRQAIALRPGYHKAHNNLGNALEAKGLRDVARPELIDEAIAAYRQAIALRSDYADAHANLADALQARGQFGEAITACRHAIALNPKSPQAHNKLGNVLEAMGQPHEAIASYREAIAIKPDSPDGYGNLGNALGDLGQLDEAIAAHRQAIALKPDYAEAHCNLGIALHAHGQVDDAIAAFRHALALNPRLALTHYNLAVSLQAGGLPDEAIDAYRRAIALRPDYAEAHYNLALLLLVRGDFASGWDEHEWRWECKAFPSPRRDFAQPLWDGQPLPEETLLLHAEQGLGDTIQFIRYLPLAAQRARKIVLVCQPQIQRLARVFAGDNLAVSRGLFLPDFDVHCPLLSLPRALGTTLQTIPGQAPYLHADVEAAAKWRQRVIQESADRSQESGTERLAGPSPRSPDSCLLTPPLRVGLAWAGSTRHTNDRNRSMRLAVFAPLARAPGVSFYSLQKGDAAGQTKGLPEGLKLIDWTEELQDFADTAALIANLDLVISVNTAVAHLAGAMAKPVWVLLPHEPDWRWLLEREDSPWYPTMRLFRQPCAGNWESVVDRVVERLSRGAV